MLPSAQRLKWNIQKHAWSNGPRRLNGFRAARITGPLISVRYRKNGDLYNRYAFIVPLRVAARSVARNRLRRVMAAEVRESGFLFFRGHDVVVSILSGVAAGGPGIEGAIRKELRHALVKVCH